MHIEDIFARDETTYSIEFFPPKTDSARQSMHEALQQLKPLRPSFVDVTYGAGGGTREATYELVREFIRDHRLTVVPHLTTVCHREHEVASLIEKYAELGVDNILALSGDLPRDKPNWDRGQDAFRYAAELVKWIKAFNARGTHPNGRGFGIGVAGFPEGHHATANRMDELNFLKAKCEAGADWVCTQFCFDTREILDWRERCDIVGIRTPILVGIMPITSYGLYENLPRFGLGAKYPAALMRQVEAHKGDDDAVLEIGIAWSTQQCRELLDSGVRGLHFYGLNKAHAVKRIFQNLGLVPGSAPGSTDADAELQKQA